MAKRESIISNSNLHINNRHRVSYDFSVLCKSNLPLKKFVFVNTYKNETIDFANPEAVKELNRSLLFTYYDLHFWEFPNENLCPPVPGRVDYIHYLADLLKSSSIKENIKIVDIGTGASCIYPILGHAVYGWNFVATDSDQNSLDSAAKILKKNNLSKQIRLRHQSNSTQIFKGILKPNEKFTATICNPPFYRSQEDAMQANARKLKGLGVKNRSEARNFSGKQQELWYNGGEKAFVHTYLYESSMFKTQCFWYSTLVSKKENLDSIYSSLEKLEATKIKTIPMQQGNKITRIVAWTFLDTEAQKKWNLQT